MPISLCVLCQQSKEVCNNNLNLSVQKCDKYIPLLTKTLTERLDEIAAKPSISPYDVVAAFLHEYDCARVLHDWSTYDLLKAARKVLAEACEVVHAVEHWDEGRDTLEHVVEELNHVGGTSIRMRLMVEGMRGKE